MGKYSVKLMKRALQDLDGIYAYIAQNLQETGAALKLVCKIEEKIFSLKQIPYCCPERKNGTYANRGYRQSFVGNFTVVFHIDEAKKHVLLVIAKYTPSQI